jgi:signal transduction histidine kinase
VSWLPRLLNVASFRFAAFYVLVFTASAFILGVAVFVEARSALQQQMDERVKGETEFLHNEFVTQGRSMFAAMVEARGLGDTALDYLLQDRDVHLAGEIPAQPKLVPGWTIFSFPQLDHPDRGPERVRAFVSDLGDNVFLAVGSDLDQISELEDAIARAFVGVVAPGVAIGIAGGLLLSRAFLRRVDIIGRTAEAIIDGDLGRRVPLQGTGDDLDRLAGTLNHMLDRVAILMESLRQVSSDVAHDLRTPLTRLYQKLEGTRAHARTVADYRAAIEEALIEAQALLETFSAILRIAQVEGQAQRANFAPVDLAALAETVVDAYRPDAEEAGHALTATLQGQTLIAGDKELLLQALANLVENALRHTPAGTRISVRVAKETGARPVLWVSDDGPGVSPDDLPRLAERFYRAERSRTTPGNGLGLSLVAAVAELHGAEFELLAQFPGLRATLRFPAPQTGVKD